MALYLVSYDISEKDAIEYDGLWAKLKELGAVRILFSEWAIEGDSDIASPSAVGLATSCGSFFSVLSWPVPT